MWLDRFCNFIWLTMTRNLETEAERVTLEARLWMPPPKVEPTVGPWSPAAEMKAFASLRASLGK